MNFLRLALRGLIHYRRTHFGVLAGMVIASATLVGALVVGDSVRYSLMRGALERIGSVHNALGPGERFLRAELATPLGSNTAPAILVSGVGSSPDGARRSHDVQVLGVDERFFQLSPGAQARMAPGPGEALINREMARRLGLSPTDSMLLRVELPSALPRDMALAPVDASLALRVRVSEVLDAAEFANFGLQGGSLPRANVLVGLEWLQEQLEIPGRANLMLAGEANPKHMNDALARNWQLADAELQITPLGDGRLELSTGRIFFDDPIVRVLEALPDVPLEGVFTYFVNGLEIGTNAVPYSMVAGLGPLNAAGRATPGPESRLVQSLEPGQLLLNDWAAEDLGALKGAALELTFYVVDASRQLIERSQLFEVAGKVPMDGAAGDPRLMPAFPGLADSENCRDWEPGTPVDLDRIRDKDELYWDEHGGTPKAFITLQAARELWTSRFGTLTAVRFPASGEAAVRAALANDLPPAELGLFFRDVRVSALAGGDSATDFGGLFMGLSFFLIVAAALLAAQLFLFGIEQRAAEIGLYGALGFSRALVQRLLLTEVALLATLGAGLGCLAGLGYTRLVLIGLESIWSDAIASAQLQFHGSTATILLGFSLSMLASVATAWFALRKALGLAPARLLNSAGSFELDGTSPTPGNRRFALGIAASSLVLALALVLFVDPAGGPSAAGAFLAAGALVLVGTLVLCRDSLRSPRFSTKLQLPTLTALGLRNITRRPTRSWATIALMATGTFLVLAVGANRLGPTQIDGRRASGTGGFALYGRSSLPVLSNLNTPLGRETLGLDEESMAGVEVVPMRILAGDDASCLNLARPQAPPLLGVPSEQLARRGAFQFAATIEPVANPWTLLAQPLADGAIPAIADITSLTWQMHMSVGDSLTYTDERGRPFELRIVGAVADSILQGVLLIEERQFEQLFPTQGGHRRFLIDAPAERAQEVSLALTRGMRDLGFAVEPTAQRLDSFHAVQNTYLSIFQGLGALGLLLGSVGFGMVLLRNTYERRSELVLVAALGFSPGRIRWWVFGEYGFLLLLGLGAGALAALFAVLPGMAAPGSDLSLVNFFVLLGAVAASGLFWLGVATRVAVHKGTP